MDENTTKITQVVNSNEIILPMEWAWKFEFASGFAQITLVDDRIVIHNPLNTAVEYTAPCKVDNDSYIRTFSLFSVKVPKQLLDRLNISIGDKIDISLEEHGISFRKNIDTEQLSETQQIEPIAGFCCVCGKLLYTESMLRVLKKYICPDCVDLVKTL